MNDRGGLEDQKVLPVPRSKREARRFYDSISGIYDALSALFERKNTEKAIELSPLSWGETVIDIGFGTGYSLQRISEKAGPGEVMGLDLSPGMVRQTLARLGRAGIEGVNLVIGDAACLPWRDEVLDAAFMGFTLELFDTPEIPVVLGEVRRVLKDGGRFSITSLSREKKTLMLRVYEWAHGHWPAKLDCRPIYVEQSMEEAGFEIIESERSGMMGLPVKIIVAEKGREGSKYLGGFRRVGYSGL
ncbi:MAG: methyltransferase domain-containing protein [Candidatus Bathyarchaeota archaeon]